MRTVYLSVALSLLSACSTRPAYYWADYPDGLYRYYNQASLAASVRNELIDELDNNTNPNYIVAPGIYAELGTYFLEAGELSQALVYYQKERDLWPESAGLMTALINNLQSRSNAAPTQ